MKKLKYSNGFYFYYKMAVKPPLSSRFEDIATQKHLNFERPLCDNNNICSGCLLIFPRFFVTPVLLTELYFEQFYNVIKPRRCCYKTLPTSQMV